MNRIGCSFLECRELYQDALVILAYITIATGLLNEIGRQSMLNLGYESYIG